MCAIISPKLKIGGASMNRFKELMGSYIDKFGDSFPLMMYCDTKEEAMVKIQACLDENKPAEELFPVNLSDDELI